VRSLGGDCGAELPAGASDKLKAIGQPKMQRHTRNFVNGMIRSPLRSAGRFYNIRSLKRPRSLEAFFSLGLSVFRS